MRKISLIVLCVIVFFGMAFSQSITVTSPTANKVWFKGETYTITWTSSGSMPNQVRIALVNEAANAVVQNIVTETANDGNHPWSVPMNVPNGRYKIAIKVKGQNITGVSPAFDIRVKMYVKKPLPIPKTIVKAEPKVTITRPYSKSGWNFGDWKYISIETNFEAHYFRIDLTSLGKRVFLIHEGALAPYAKVNITRRYRYHWQIPVQSADNGYYRVRVKATSTEGEIEGMSDSFYLSDDITFKTSEIMLQPTLMRNRYSRRRESYEWRWDSADRDYKPRPDCQNRPGRLRVGFENNYQAPGQWTVSWWYFGFIFRSHVTFSFAEVKDKIRLPLKATLILQKKESFAFKTQLTHGAGKLYVMTAPWDGRAIDTPGYFYKDIPQTSASRIEIDILQQVKDWLNGTEENLGFLIVGAKEDFAHNDEVMVSFFNAELKLRYLEEE